MCNKCMRAENIIFLLLLLYILFHYFKRSEVEYLYIRNFLPEQEHKKVVEECRKLEPFMEKDELSIVKNRNKHGIHVQSVPMFKRDNGKEVVVMDMNLYGKKVSDDEFAS